MPVKGSATAFQSGPTTSLFRIKTLQCTVFNRFLRLLKSQQETDFALEVQLKILTAVGRCLTPRTTGVTEGIVSQEPEMAGTEEEGPPARSRGWKYPDTPNSLGSALFLAAHSPGSAVPGGHLCDTGQGGGWWRISGPRPSSEGGERGCERICKVPGWTRTRRRGSWPTKPRCPLPRRYRPPLASLTRTTAARAPRRAPHTSAPIAGRGCG